MTDQSQHDNRRSFHRYNTERLPIKIHRSDRKGAVLPANLINESIGGIGVSATSVAGLSFGQCVGIDGVASEITPGYIRGITRTEAGDFTINISWNDHAKCENGRRVKQVAHFISFQGIRFVCDMLYNDVGPFKTVRLWDGAIFKVNADDVCAVSVDARRSELTQIEKFEQVSKMYKLPVPATKDQLEALLDFEFGFQSTSSGGSTLA